MAITFDGANTQYLRNAAPTVINYPFTVGMWLRLAATGTPARVMFSLTDPTSTTHFIKMQMTTAELYQQSANAGTTANSQTAAGGTNWGGNDWQFVIFRGVDAGERRSSVYSIYESVPIYHLGGSVTSKAPTLTTMVLGAHESSSGFEEPWDGSIAEFWVANDDVGNSGEELNQALLLQLAFKGPFSVPHIAGKISDYRSFLSGVDSPQDKLEWTGKRNIWTAGNGPFRVCSHPPLSSEYIRPGQTQRLLVV